MKASYIVKPFDGIANNAPEGVKVSYTVGCYGMHRKLQIAVID